MEETETPYVTVRYVANLKNGETLFGVLEQVEPNLPCTYERFVSELLEKMMIDVLDTEWLVLTDGLTESAVLTRSDNVATIHVDVLDGFELFDGESYGEPPF